ncbi:MAG: metalloregulator ArsR/SmtB family transcription factor [Oligoflexia bacterium]|nr:metalloregulator ArsR/SmtB family transcription factor [Oligoflexia bacterium]
MSKAQTLSPLLEQCDLAARTIKLLAHPQRLMILCYLSEGSKSVGELQRLCGCSQSLISQFLARMKSEDLVTHYREGKFVRYEIRNRQILQLIRALHKIFCP